MGSILEGSKAFMLVKRNEEYGLGFGCKKVEVFKCRVRFFEFEVYFGFILGLIWEVEGS